MNATDLKKLIAEKGVSVPKLARMTGLHPQTIYNFLWGKSSMSADNYNKCAEALGHKVIFAPL